MSHVNLCPAAREILDKVKKELRKETGKEKISYSDTVFYLHKKSKDNSQ